MLSVERWETARWVEHFLAVSFSEQENNNEEPRSSPQVIDWFLIGPSPFAPCDYFLFALFRILRATIM